MTIKAIKKAALALTAAVIITVPVQAHHSFAMYDLSKRMAITGVLVRSNPDAFHYQMFIAQLDANRKSVLRDQAGKPLIWVIELEGAAQVASKGVTAGNFPAGAIVSVGFYPLRNGNPGGARVGLGLFKCPAKTPPAVGKHCDGVEGGQQFGGEIPADIAEAKVAAR